MFQNFLLKSLLKKQLGHLPAAEQERIFTIIEKNPDLFMNIATKAQEKIKGGMGQQDAMMAVMKEHGEELKSVLK
jgi:hypothetical protein